MQRPEFRARRGATVEDARGPSGMREEMCGKRVETGKTGIQGRPLTSKSGSACDFVILVFASSCLNV